MGGKVFLGRFRPAEIRQMDAADEGEGGGMLTFSASATYGASEPLERLSDLVGKRCELLGETVKDAAVGTMITALTAIRAQTRKARAKGRTRAKVAMRDDLVPSYSRRIGRRCLRNRQGRRLDLSVRVDWAAAGVPFRSLKVYHVTPENGRVAPYLVVAESQKAAATHESGRVARRIASMGGLARFALGLAAAKVSTRPAAADGAGRGASQVAPRFVGVTVSAAGRDGFIEVRDSLGYAALALKGGAAAVDLALRRAANKVAGRLMKWAADNGRLAAAVSTPFPEVVRRRGA